MGDAHDDLASRMTIAKMVSDRWEQNPPDTSEWVRALEGCAELFQHAANHIRHDRYREAARVIATACDTGEEVHQQTVMAYVMSGEATEDFLATVREQLGEEGDDAAM